MNDNVSPSALTGETHTESHTVVPPLEVVDVVMEEIVSLNENGSAANPTTFMEAAEESRVKMEESQLIGGRQPSIEVHAAVETGKGISILGTPSDEQPLNSEVVTSKVSTCGRREFFRQSVSDLFARVRESPDIEKMTVLFESALSVWEGLAKLSNICPTWSSHCDNRGQSNILFHKMAIHGCDSMALVLSYFAILREVTTSTTVTDQTIVETVEMLDSVRLQRGRPKINRETQTMPIGENVVALDESSEFSVTRKSYSSCKELNEGNASQITSEEPEESPTDKTAYIPLSLEVLCQNIESCPPQLPSTPQQVATSADPLMRLLDDIKFALVEPEATSTVHKRDTPAVCDDDETAGGDEEWTATTNGSTKPRNKRQKVDSTTSAQPGAASVSHLDLASPCQGVCWDPTHQRWVAHWSDAKTHQRIRRYFNPKLMGFHQARLFAVLTRREAVDSGRASMITKPDRRVGGTSVKDDGKDGFDEYIKGVYWNSSEVAYYCYWRASQDLQYQAFPVSQYMDRHKNDFNASVRAAREEVISFRNSLITSMANPTIPTSQHPIPTSQHPIPTPQKQNPPPVPTPIHPSVIPVIEDSRPTEHHIATTTTSPPPTSSIIPAATACGEPPQLSPEILTTPNKHAPTEVTPRRFSPRRRNADAAPCGPADGGGVMKEEVSATSC